MNRRSFIKGFLTTATVVALAPLAPVVELSTELARFYTLEEMMQECLIDFRCQVIRNLTDGNPFHAFITSKPIIMNEEQLEEYFLNEPYKKSELIVLR